MSTIVADFDENGQVTFYDTSLAYSDGVPASAVPVSQEQWIRHLEGESVLRHYGGGQIVEDTPVAPSLDQKRARALSEARARARKIRIEIAGIASPERAIAWVIKSFYAAAWDLNDQAAHDGLVEFAAIAEEAFQIEAEITGEDQTDLRNRTLANARHFLMATQFVEGMERLAERKIADAISEAELETAINQLTALEAQALSKLNALKKGGKNDA